MHAADRDGPEPKALACYGLWLPGPERILLRFVAGRPVSAATRAVLAWIADRLAPEGVRVLALVRDDAPGTSAARCGPGAQPPIAGSRLPGAAAGCWSVVYRARVRG